MSPRSLDEKRRSFAHTVATLATLYPNAHIELNYRTPLELLVAVVLSAQCTDARVNLATPALFERFRTASDYAAARAGDIEPFIKSLGLFRAKAKNLAALGRELARVHGGEVPTRRADLAELPGVGLKTAGVVSAHLGGDPAFPVDTHVFRLSHRMGLSRGKTPEAVEADLQKLAPPESWISAHQLVIWHGRRVCHARTPACDDCALASTCPKRGV